MREKVACLYIFLVAAFPTLLPDQWSHHVREHKSGRKSTWMDSKLFFQFASEATPVRCDETSPGTTTTWQHALRYLVSAPSARTQVKNSPSLAVKTSAPVIVYGCSNNNNYGAPPDAIYHAQRFRLFFGAFCPVRRVYTARVLLALFLRELRPGSRRCKKLFCMQQF
jgi:hypothetical protein